MRLWPRPGKEDALPSRPLRALRFLLLPPLAVWTAWMVAIHLFLWTPLLRAILRREDVFLDYRSAWSVWPGTLHLQGVVLALTDTNIEFRLTIDELKTTVHLFQLPRRIFHTSRVFARGITFRLRGRVPRPDATPELLGLIPPIEGFDPIRTEQPDEEVPDWAYKTFSIWLEDINGQEVREVWINELRLTGQARVGGSFYLKPGRLLRVEPGLFWADGMALYTGQHQILRDLQGPLRLRLGPVNPHHAKPDYLARFADLDSDLTGQFAGPGFLDEGLSGGEGPLHLALHLQSGQLLPGSVLDLESRFISARARKGSLEGTLRRAGFSLELPAGPPPHTARARLELTGLEAGSAKIPEAACADLSIEFAGDPPDLAALVLPREATIDLRGGTVRNAQPFVELQSKILRVLSGRGTFAAHLSGPPRRLRGFLQAELKNGLVLVQGRTIRAELVLGAKVRALDPLDGADLAGSQLEVLDGQLVFDNGQADAAPGWWGRFELPRAQVRFAPQGNEPMLDADLAARCRDARPLVGLFARQAELPRFVASLFSMNGLEVRGSASLGPQLFALRGLAAEGEGAKIQAVYRLRGEEKRGAAYLSVGPLSVSLGVEGDNKSVHILSPGSWFAEEQAKLQPELALGSLPRGRRMKKPHAPPVQSAERAGP